MQKVLVIMKQVLIYTLMLMLVVLDSELRETQTTNYFSVL